MVSGTSSASASCPPPPPAPISPFGLLAFALISVNAAINVVNAIDNNNNNNRNNNNRNNNNQFNQNNLNVNPTGGRRKRRSSRAVGSPWSAESIRRHWTSTNSGSGFNVASSWLAGVMSEEPSCVSRIGCDLANR